QLTDDLPRRHVSHVGTSRIRSREPQKGELRRRNHGLHGWARRKTEEEGRKRGLRTLCPVVFLLHPCHPCNPWFLLPPVAGVVPFFSFTILRRRCWGWCRCTGRRRSQGRRGRGRGGRGSSGPGAPAPPTGRRGPPSRWRPPLRWAG